MQRKKITAIAVLLLVVASVSISGCTTSTKSNTNQTPNATQRSATTSTATHDAFLEKYIAEDKNYTSSASAIGNFTTWKVTWINGTTARVEWTAVNNSRNQTVTSNSDKTYILFQTTEDATQYLNAMNKTEYNILSTNYGHGPYMTVTGSAPATYKVYTRPSGTQEYYGIRQLDNIIEIINNNFTIT